MNKKYEFTPEMVEELKAIYPYTNSQELASHFNCSYSSICYHAQKHGLKKDIEWVKETSRRHMLNEDHPGRKHWIKKGNIPVNKGKRQDEYMSEQSIEKTKATRFTKCHIPVNHKPVGYERVDTDGYIYVKIAEPNVFKLKHRVVWERHNGEIEKGYNIQFRDGNRQNCSIDNLYIISRKEQMKNENCIHARYSGDLKKSIYTLKSLNIQIKKHEKSNRN